MLTGTPLSGSPTTSKAYRHPAGLISRYNINEADANILRAAPRREGCRKAMKTATVPDAKLAHLREILRKLNSVVVAYSGGVDSTFLMWVAADELGNGALAVTARSETYPKHEAEEALSMARGFGFRHRVVQTSELAIPGFRYNPPERCYYCKSELFATLRMIADEEGIRYVADGSTVSDITDYRPGRKAAEEKDVLSPLIQAGLNKEEVRTLSKELGVPTWNKPAFACLASRFPYHEEITEEKLSRVALAEEYLRSLGIRQYRVRHHGPLARIEVEHKDIEILLKREDLIGRFRKLGFTYVTVDLEGYRPGSMNDTLTVQSTNGRHHPSVPVNDEPVNER